MRFFSTRDLTPVSSVLPPALQPKYIPEFIAKQAEADADIVTGSRYIAGGGVAGWDFRRKLTSCGANILAATLLQPRARTLCFPAPFLLQPRSSRMLCSHSRSSAWASVALLLIISSLLKVPVLQGSPAVQHTFA